MSDWISLSLAKQRPSARPAGWPTHKQRARSRRRNKAARARQRAKERNAA